MPTAIRSDRVGRLPNGAMSLSGVVGEHLLQRGEQPPPANRTAWAHLDDLDTLASSLGG